MRRESLGQWLKLIHKDATGEDRSIPALCAGNMLMFLDVVGRHLETVVRGFF